MYADFDGYSNMAIGVGKLLGINITRNFNHPFLARNIAEYWRNWHISLTGWLTDYVFSPLNIAFRNLNNLGIILAVIINFVLIGFWHGANWTFGLFGLYHGLLYIPLVLSGAFGKKKKLKPNTKGLPQFTDFCKMVGTFLLVAFGLIIFRADCISDAINFITGIVTNTFFALPPISMGKVKLLIVAFLVITMLSLEWSTRNWEYPIQDISFKTLYRWCIYVALTLLILTTAGDQVQFIYFIVKIKGVSKLCLCTLEH
jgi:D-alanyl-lipoteichoic acid acyltransferase DltB (MBOAT superfamily)